MNLTVKSTQPVDLRGIMHFNDGKVFTFQMRLSGHGPAVFCVIGRSPQELVKMELLYDGLQYNQPIEINGEHLADVELYGTRDKWSQLLRNKALQACKDGE